MAEYISRSSHCYLMLIRVLASSSEVVSKFASLAYFQFLSDDGPGDLHLHDQLKFASKSDKESPRTPAISGVTGSILFDAQQGAEWPAAPVQSSRIQVSQEGGSMMPISKKKAYIYNHVNIKECPVNTTPFHD
ncbi:hypothetical protein ACTXT7_000932 [Hymenolepis weldensis]